MMKGIQRERLRSCRPTPSAKRGSRKAPPAPREQSYRGHFTQPSRHATNANPSGEHLASLGGEVIVWVIRMWWIFRRWFFLDFVVWM